MGEIAKDLKELVGLDKCNDLRAKQRFCITLEFGEGWIIQLAVGNKSNNKQSITLVDYCNLLIRCRYCMATNHLVREYLEIKRSKAKENSSDGDPLIEEANGEGDSSKTSK